MFGKIRIQPLYRPYSQCWGLLFDTSLRTSIFNVSQMEKRGPMVAAKDQMPCMWSWSLRTAMNLLSKENMPWHLGQLRPCWVGQVRISQVLDLYPVLNIVWALIYCNIEFHCVVLYIVNPSRCTLLKPYCK